MADPLGQHSQRTFWFSHTYKEILKGCKLANSRGAVKPNFLLLQGGCFHVPDDQRQDLFKLYAREAPWTNFSLVEMRGEVFPYLCDIDHVAGDAADMGEELFAVIEREVGGALQDLLRMPDGPTKCLWQFRTPINRHAIFPEALVTRSTALAVRKRAVERLKAVRPAIDWDDLLDKSVLDANGLRMLGSYKTWTYEELIRLYPQWTAREYNVVDGKPTANVSQSGMPYKKVNVGAGCYSAFAGGARAPAVTAEDLEEHSVYRPPGTEALPAKPELDAYVEPKEEEAATAEPRKRKRGARAADHGRCSKAILQALVDRGGHDRIYCEHGRPDGYKWRFRSSPEEFTCLHGGKHSGNNCCVFRKDGQFRYRCYGKECSSKGEVPLPEVSGLIARLEAAVEEDANEAQHPLPPGWERLSYHERWLRNIVDILVEKGCVALLSDMNTGKTTQIKAVVTALGIRRIISIGPRVLFELNQVADFQRAGIEIAFYRDAAEAVSKEAVREAGAQARRRAREDGLSAEDCARAMLAAEQKRRQRNIVGESLSVQMESLARLRDRACTLLVIDESESCLKAFNSRATMEGRLADCAFSLDDIIRNAKYVIAADAFLGPRTINTLTSMRPTGVVVKNTFQALNRSAYRVRNEDDWFGMIMRAAELDQKVDCVMASKRKADRLAAMLEAAGIRFLYYHGGMDEETRDTINDPNSTWNVQVIVRTPVITVGMNVTVAFDTLFAYGSAHSFCARDMFQALMRSRNILSERMYFHISSDSVYGAGGLDLPITEADVRRQVDALERATGAAGLGWSALPWLKEVQMFNMLEDNRKIVCYNADFCKYMALSGYTEKPLDEGVAFVPDAVPAQVLAVAAPPIEWSDIPTLVAKDMKALTPRLFSGTATPEERLAITKYNFLHTSMLTHTEADVEKDEIIFKHCWARREDFEKLRNAQLEKSGCLAANEADLARWKLAHAAEALAPKVSFIRNMKRALLGEGRADARLLNEEDVIPYEKMLEFATWCSTHRAKGNQLFGLRDRSEDNETTIRKATDFYNKLMKVWGFSKLQKKKKRETATINGQRIDVTSYQVVVADAWGVDGHALHYLNSRIRQIF
jgi:hypothetical protein